MDNDFNGLMPSRDSIAIRRVVLQMLYGANASHLGSNMSAIEILAAIYGSVDCQKIKLNAPDRSRVLISKGHCAAATYATLAHFQILSDSFLETYHRNGSFLAGHVSHVVHGSEHSTGALGHGINVAVGCAIGMRSCSYKDSLVFALVGDGEIQEGSVWEALMLAVHLRLENFIALVDYNGISSITKTEEVIDMRPLSNRFEGFGLFVREVNGHNVGAILNAINESIKEKKPSVIICNTVKGFGVPFAEGDPMWHYKTLSENELKEALKHIDRMESSL
jgi:transketolase